MRLLAIGDVCGVSGCEEVRKRLSNLKKEYKIDVVIINGENCESASPVRLESILKKYL